MNYSELPYLERGVYRAPCLGPDGEITIIAVDSRHRRLPEGLAFATSPQEAERIAEAFWRMLAIADPAPPSSFHTLPSLDQIAS